MNSIKLIKMQENLGKLILSYFLMLWNKFLCNILSQLTSLMVSAANKDLLPQMFKSLKN